MKELEEAITLNGKLYYDANMVRRLIIHAKEEGHKEGYEKGKYEGYKEAQVEGVAIGYTDTDIARTQEQWYQLGYEAGKKNRSPYIAMPISEYPNPSSVDYEHGYNDGYEQCKYDEISKINLNTELVEQT
jgi:flagellar biosynthesis/type III secretory pathway protein FliH